MTTVSENATQIHFCKLNCCGPDLEVSVNFALVIKEDLSWALSVCGQQVERERCSLIASTPCTITTASEVKLLLEKSA